MCKHIFPLLQLSATVGMLAAKICSALGVTETKHLLLATQSFAKPNSELCAWLKRHAGGIQKTISQAHGKEEEPARMTHSNYLQDTDCGYLPVFAIRCIKVMISFKCLHSCSSLWTLYFPITQLICVFVYLFSPQK